MYLELFQLNELPFRLSPDPQFLYLSKAHARAKAYMASSSSPARSAPARPR
jgi:general secretion pathway protein A